MRPHSLHGLPALLAAGKYDEIQALTEEAVRTMLGFELRHIGVNCEDEGAADSVASRYDELFGARYSQIFFAEIPPVGINFICV